MTQLIDVFAWKFPGKDISVNGDGAQAEIVQWPLDVPAPSAADIARWTTEYESYIASGAHLGPRCDAEIASRRLDRLQFEANYDLESRLRVLESKPSITKAQYLTALKNVYKALP